VQSAPDTAGPFAGGAAAFPLLSDVERSVVVSDVRQALAAV
jgi:hypothetical protein